MNVSLVTPFWYAPGGISSVCRELARALGGAGHSVRVFTAEKPPLEGTDRHAATFARPECCRGIFGLFTAIARAVPDVIHVHASGRLLLAAIVGRWLCPHRRPRIVFTFHTQPQVKSYLPLSPVERRSRIRAAALNFVLSRCWAVTCVSKSLAENLSVETGLDTTRSFIVPNGVSTSLLASAE